MKIIFLDIDGVLAVPSCLKDGLWGLSNEKQGLLGRILKHTDAKIVLSSSWRHSTLNETIINMNTSGFLFSDRLIGVTIRAYQYLEKGTGIHLSIPRGVEIKQWIDTHIHSNHGKNWERKKIGKDYDYVILDDDTDMLLEQKDHFFKTDSEVGLTEEIVNKVIKKLNST